MPRFRNARGLFLGRYVPTLSVTIALRHARRLRRMCEGIQPRDGAQVLLAIAASEHLFREDLIEAHPSSDDRNLRIVDTVDESDEPECLRLICQHMNITKTYENDAVDESDVSGGM